MRALLLSLVFAAASMAQEHGASPAQGHAAQAEHANTEHAAEDPNRIYWKWANFVVLFGILGFVAVKNLGPAFSAKNQQIEEALAAGSIAQAEAEKQLAEVKARLADFDREAADIKARAYAEMRRETERIDEETRRLVQKTQDQAEAEAARLTKAAQQELQRYSALLALDMAGDRVRERINKADQDRLAAEFAARIPKGANN